MLYILIITITVLDFVWTQYLAYRNRKHMNPVIPNQLIGIYDEEKYTKQQLYQRDNSRLGLLSGTFFFIIMLFIFIFQGFGWLDLVLRENIQNEMLLTLCFLSILFVANEIITIPFSFYDTFVIETKYGFNTSNKKMFWTDQIKGLFLALILGGIVLSALTLFYNSLGSNAWLYAWGLVTLFSLFMILFYSNVIVPLFNKQTPLQQGELRDEIEKFSNRAGFELTDIYVIDASKRSTKANAYFTGLGKKKRIVLYDTLINDLTTDEIVAVLAHEIGHYKKKHTLQGLLISTLQTGILLFILSYFVQSQSLAEALGSNDSSFHLGIIAFTVLFTPISMILGIVMNIISRKNEYQADAFAAQYGLSDALISGLKKLSIKSLSNLNPDSWYVFFYYSHPTLLQRIAKLKS